MYVRTYGDPVHIISAVRGVIRRLDSSVPIIEISTLEQEVQNSLWQERLVAILSMFFAIVALALAALGLYGALAYSVTQRSRELGIRIAVGAQVRHILQTVCGRMTWSVGFGLAGGVIASVLLLKLTRHLLFGVDPLDPLSFIAGSGAVVFCAIVAATIPSWRAVKIDPSAALREE